MKKLLLNACLAFSLAATITISGCKKDNPDTQACIKTTGNDYNTGQAISFTSCSEDADTYAWDFGDGTTSDNENPTHTFALSGTYEVTLVVDGPGGTSTITETITVTPRRSDFLGDYSADESCTSGMYDYTMSVTAGTSSNGIIFISLGGFGPDFTPTATISGSQITIPTQTVNGLTITGSGTLSANLSTLSISYNIADTNGNTDQCTITAVKL